MDYITRNRVITGRKLVMTSARLWSRKTQEGRIFDMKNEIRDLLQAVDREMLRAYALKYLNGTTIAGVLQQLEAIKGDPVKTLHRTRYLFPWYFSAVLVLGFSLPYPGYVGTLWGIVLIGFMLVYTLNLQKRTAIVWSLLGHLENFQEAVRALNPDDDNVTEYNEASVRQTLIYLAMRVLEAEKNLDVVRLQEQSDEQNLQHTLGWLQKCRAMFNSTRNQAGSFGLEYGKQQLFADAKSRIARL